MDDIPKDFNDLEVIESCYNTTKPQMGKASNMLMVLLSHSVSRGLELSLTGQLCCTDQCMLSYVDLFICTAIVALCYCNVTLDVL